MLRLLLSLVAESPDSTREAVAEQRHASDRLRRHYLRQEISEGQILGYAQPRARVASATRATATQYAPVRMSTLCLREDASTSPKARVILRSSRRCTSSSSHGIPRWFCTHSKYDTVTPPALHRKSGMTKTLRLCSTMSASGVSGPLAASATIRAFTRAAFSAVI